SMVKVNAPKWQDFWIVVTFRFAKRTMSSTENGRPVEWEGQDLGVGGAEGQKMGASAGIVVFRTWWMPPGRDNAVGQATAMEKSDSDGQVVHGGFEEGKVQAGMHEQPQGATSPIALL
ncbi:MAG: hypothetical protein IKQ15_01560, partial [Kiritimatiellae bacterium]|nr:hypothetical protein [Kiritimatiellia bacterium]